jgi:biotin transport system ATP-binding protein
MAIVVDQITHKFDDVPVIDGVSLDMPERRIGIIGANGSGKSTLARLIAGLIAPDDGTVRVNDVDVFKDRKGALETIGIIFQNPDHQIIFPTCVEEIAFGLIQQGLSRAEADKRARAILAKYDRGDWADRLAHHLSQGQRHFLCLISILAMTPNTIILDEPYAGLDLPTSLRLHRTLADLEQQVVMITHDPRVLADFDRIIWLDQGRVVGDGAADVILPKFNSEMEARANVRD